MAKPNRKLRQAIKRFSNQKQEVVIPIQGILGLPLGGSKLVDVPNRKGFVYVRLRDNTSEVIQAYNSEVSSIYGLAVLVVRQNNIYKVLGRDQDRYQDWGNIPYLPKHGGQHSFNQGLGMGADITWVYTQQFMPLLGYPSGTNGSNGIVISPYTIRDLNGNWKYVGNTGTPDITMYRPSTGTQAVMVLVYIDSVSGNPFLLVGSGSYFSATLTGSSDIAPYIPPVTNPNWIPDTAVRLTSGTTQIFWGNMYDVRPFLQPIPTGSGGGAGSNGTGFVIWDEGIPKGTASILNVVSDVADISISGTVARLFITGSAGGGGINTGTLDARYLKLDTSNDPLTGLLDIIPILNDTQGLNIETLGDASSFSTIQRATGSVGVLSPSFSVTREPYGDSSSTFAAPVIQVTQSRNASGTISGGLLSFVSDGTERININPSAQGTGTLAYFDGDFVLSPSGLLLLLENNGVSKFYVNASGTAYSNGVPLIKEAPTGTGLQYARKNAGWEPVTSSGGSSGTFLVTEDLTSQINGSNVNFVLSNFPDPITSTRLYYNGVRQRYLFHYTVSGSYVQTLYTPTTGSVLTVDYTESSSTGTINGLIQVQDEGVALGNVNTLNFVGVDVSASIVGATATIMVTGSPGGTVLIQKIIPTGSSTCTFLNIPQTYEMLIVEAVTRTNLGAATAPISLYFNNDLVSANYRRINLTSDGTNATAGSGDNSGFFSTAGNSALANNAGRITMEILDYATPSFEKGAFIRTSRRDGASTQVLNDVSVWWENTGTITRIDFNASGTYLPGSVFRLYAK